MVSGYVLAKTVEEQPMLRAYALTAMASLDENVCRVHLAEMLASKSPEVRYGSFRALDGQAVVPAARRRPLARRGPAPQPRPS